MRTSKLQWLSLMLVLSVGWLPAHAQTIEPASFLNTEFHFSEDNENDKPTEALVILVPEGTTQIALSGAALSTRQHLEKAIQAVNFKAERDKQLEVIAPLDSSFQRVLLLGLGKPEALKRSEAEELGAAVSVWVNESKVETVSVHSQLIEDETQNARIVSALAHGTDLRNYRFDRFKSEPEARPAQQYFWQVRDKALTEKHYTALRALAEGVFTARELTNLPGSAGNPEAFEQYARAVLEPLGVDVTVIQAEQLKELGMGALYGVSQGGIKPARLLIARWKGAEGKPLALVGKGVTFDTGGYNLKTTSSSIIRMHTDKSGAAGVVGAVQALAAQKQPVHVVAVAPLVINMVSEYAQLPGDVVKAGDGSTIEVANTDAEGRLILSDAIWYAREKLQARVIVDMATLTGSKVRALGTSYAALFTQQQDLEKSLREAGERVAEPLWPLPLDGYPDIIKSRIADRKNTGSPGAQAGAILLQHFAGDTPWAHIDMAGDAFVESAKGIHPAGSTGYGVRLLTEWVKLYEGIE